MAGRKKAKSKTKRISFRLGDSLGKKKQKTALHRPSLTGILKVLVVVCALAATGAALYFAEKYVKSTTPVETGPLVLKNAPEWATAELKTKIFAAAGQKYIDLDDKAARLVAENLASVGWLDDVKVQTTHDNIIIEGRWRKPLALVKSGFNKFYVDAESVVLDFVAVPGLPIVQVKGVYVTQTPPAGSVLEKDNLTAAVTILAALERMDESVTPEKPLLYEIDSIDVSNFNGRQNHRQPHIILYTTDNTEIIWGAEFGAWQQHLEATDEEKLAKLYGYYKEFGSLLGGARYINLRNPQNDVSLPVDKY